MCAGAWGPRQHFKEALIHHLFVLLASSCRYLSGSKIPPATLGSPLPNSACAAKCLTCHRVFPEVLMPPLIDPALVTFETPVQSQAWGMFCFDVTWLLHVLGLALVGEPFHFGPALRGIMSSDQRTKGRTRTECSCPPAPKIARPLVAMHLLLGDPELSQNFNLEKLISSFCLPVLMVV